jgi:hypothetical protein
MSLSPAAAAGPGAAAVGNGTPIPATAAACSATAGAADGTATPADLHGDGRLCRAVHACLELRQDQLFVLQDDEAFHHVFELADVARP